MPAAEAAISAAFAEALRADRESYNARVAQAEFEIPGFDRESFRLFLKQVVDPACAAVDEHQPDAARRVAQELFDFGILLVRRRMAGDRAPVQVALRQLLPPLAPLVAEHPALVARTLSNAVVHVAESGGEPQLWTETLALAARQVESLDSLRAGGAVAAWLAGLPMFREAALDALEELREPIAAALLTVGVAELEDTIQGFREDPWPQRREVPALVGQLGEAALMGGAFHALPRVFRMTDGLVATDGMRWWRIYADGFGMQLIAAPPPLSSSREPAPRWSFQQAGGRISRNGRSADFPQLAGASSWTAEDDLLVATSPLSFRIFLVI